MNRRQFHRRSLLGGAGLLSSTQIDWMSDSISMLSPSRIPKTDTHVHLINLERFSYPWLESAPEIKKPCTLEDFAKVARKSRIGKIVFMESGALPEQSLQEIDWVIEQAKLDARLTGIIARGDVDRDGQLSPRAEELTKSGWVKGIRGRVNKELLQSSGFVNGMKELGRNRLSVDLLLSPALLAIAAETIRKCPDTVFMLDHMGYPDVKAGEDEVWRKGLAKLAEHPNVNCKISGAINKAGRGWTAEIMKPFVHGVIQTFGFDRIVYGGDWPNSLRVSDAYSDWSRAFEKLTRKFSESELNRLYHLNADRIYQLT